MATQDEIKRFRLRTGIYVAAMLLGVICVNMFVSRISSGRQETLLLADELRQLTAVDQLWYSLHQEQFEYVSQHYHPDSTIVGVEAANADDALVRDIANRLQQSTRLSEFTRLRLRGRDLSDGCIKDIARFPSLTHLGLGDGKITGVGFSALKQHQLIRLELNGLDLKDADWSALQPGLQALTLEDCRIAPNRFRPFLNRLSELTELRLVNVELNGQLFEILEALNHSSDAIAIGGDEVTNEVVQRLEQTLSAKKLGFPNANIDDDAVDSILKIQTYSELDLSNTKVTDQGVAKLGERVANTDYFRLNLSGTELNGSAFKGWKASPLWLDLSNTNVDDKLGKTLPFNLQGMRQLKLASTNVTDAILPQLKCPFIYELDISNTAITGGAMLRSGFGWHCPECDHLPPGSSQMMKPSSCKPKVFT